MWLTWLPEAARMTGYPVDLVPGWPTRGHGAMTEVRGVVGHHTASQADGDYPSLRVVRDGRSDLPGPLAQLGLTRSGRIPVIAAGHAYHAGQGTGWGISSPPAFGGARTIGIEAESRGFGIDWTDAEIDCYPRLVAAVILTAHKYGHLVGSVAADKYMGHLDWARPLGRKVDPRASINGTLSTGWMRARVAYYLVNPDQINRNNQEDELSAAEVKTIVDSITKVQRVTEATYNQAKAAVAQVQALTVALARGYDVIQTAGDSRVWAVIGDSRVHLTQQTLPAFGGWAAVKQVTADDPRMTLPVIELPEVEDPE